MMTDMREIPADAEKDMTELEGFLEKPYWIVDFLPKQVPADSPGRYFAVEAYYLRKRMLEGLRRHFLGLFLKLNCYYALRVSTDSGEHWEENPSPEELGLLFMRAVQDLPRGKGVPSEDGTAASPEEEQEDGAVTIHILVGDEALAVLDEDETNMTVYGPGEELLELLRSLAASEGLFVWQPPQA